MRFALLHYFKCSRIPGFGNFNNLPCIRSAPLRTRIRVPGRFARNRVPAYRWITRRSRAVRFPRAPLIVTL